MRGLVSLLILALALVAACQPRQEAGAVASVDGHGITLADFRARSAFMGLGDDPKVLTPQIRRAVLESLVSSRVIIDYAQSQGIKLEPEELDREERFLRRGLSQADFEQAMTTQGLAYVQWRGELKKQLWVKKTLDLVLAPQVRATPEEVRAYYNSHKEEFRRPDQVLAQHALLPTRKLAQTLVSRVMAGKDMARAAAKLGAPLVDGGEPMWLSRGHMPQELEDKVFATRPGSLAGPLASPYGFHVVRVVAKRAAGVTQLIDAAEDIQRKLSAGKMEAKASAWTEELRSRAEIWFDKSFEATGASAGASGR